MNKDKVSYAKYAIVLFRIIYVFFAFLSIVFIIDGGDYPEAIITGLVCVVIIRVNIFLKSYKKKLEKILEHEKVEYETLKQAEHEKRQQICDESNNNSVIGRGYMGLFDKAKYEEYDMKFRLIVEDGDKEAGVVNLEAYGNIYSKDIYCIASYQLSIKLFDENLIQYDEIVKLLSDSNNKTIKVKFKVKNNELKSFKMNLDSLVELYNDDRLNKLELLATGLNDKSYLEYGKV